MVIYRRKKMKDSGIKIGDSNEFGVDAAVDEDGELRIFVKVYTWEDHFNEELSAWINKSEAGILIGQKRRSFDN